MWKALHHRMSSSLGMPKIILRLHIHPEFRGGAQGSRKSQGHTGGDARLAVEHSRQSDAGDTQVRCGRRNGHVAEVFTKYKAGMWWIMHVRSPRCDCDPSDSPDSPR